MRRRAMVVAAVFGAIFLLAVLTVPAFYALLAGIALVVLFILMDARRNVILWVMGWRNILRRKGTTALVISGLMVGTAIISASFVVGDTLNNMIVGDTIKGSGGADIVVGVPGGDFFDEGVAASLEADLGERDNIAMVRSFTLSSAGVLDIDTQLSDAAASLMGLSPELLSSYDLVDREGDRVVLAPAEGGAYINEKMATELDAAVGHRLIVLSGNSSVDVVVQRIVRYEGLGSYRLEPTIYLDVGTAAAIAGHDGHRNTVFVSLSGRGAEEVAEARRSVNETLSSYSSQGLKIIEDRQTAIDEGLEDMATYTSLFFMLGSFSVIAGIVLIANLFTMLGEERKGEMGISRAVGMKRSQLVRVFTYEGMLYAAIAAGVGTLTGLALAYVLINLAGDVLDLGDFPVAQYFAFTPFSLAIAYVMGFLLTLAVVYVVTRRISNLNIMRAVRNIPEPPLARNDRRSQRAGGALLLGGGGLILLGIVLSSQLLAMGGLSSVTMSLGFLLRRAFGDKAAWNLSAAATLFIWLPLPFDIFPYEGFIELFVLAGVFMVSAALIIVMLNSDQIIWLFTKGLWTRGPYRAVVKTAISYPLKSKFRTALSIFIFGLVIFTVTTLSVMSGVLEAGIPKMAAEVSGGHDIIAFTNPLTPVEGDLWERTNASTSFISGSNLTGVVSLRLGTGLITTRTEGPTGTVVTNDTVYNVVGFESTLFTQGEYWLSDWDRQRFPSEREVWEAVLGDTSLVIVDGNMLSTEINEFVPGPKAAVGDEIFLTTANGTSSFTVAGIMKQPVLTGLFVSNEFTERSMGIEHDGVYLIDLQEGLDVDRQAALLEREFLANGMQTIPVDTVARELVQQINGVFTLFRAFLGLGLIVGISGLGIITIRSIRERRIEIGVMRAIGYTKGMVVANFALESSFISFMGIVIGTLLGISVGYTVYLEAFEALGYDFVIPWWEILAVGVGAFLATLLSVLPAARGASRVSPAEVLRFE